MSKHLTETTYFTHIKATDINSLEGFAIEEHAANILHLTCVQVFDAFYFLQLGKS